MNNLEQNHYFDTNALFKYYHNEKGSLRIRRLVSNASHPIIVSSLTVLECFGVIMEYYRRGNLKKKHVNDLYQRLDKDMGKNKDTNRPFQIIEMPDGVFQLAKNILFQYAYSFRVESNDALHLAIVKKLQTESSSITMITSDKSMQKVCEHLGIPFFNPEIE
jgi:predicted nucleic acid-binding protein